MSLTEIVSKKLELFDFCPQLDRRVISLPMTHRFVILSDNKGRSYSIDPQIYLINDMAEPTGIHYMYPQDMFGTMLAAKAIRKRAQIINKNLMLFVRDVDLIQKCYKEISNLIFLTEDEEDLDAEILARIAWIMHKNEISSSEISKTLTMDASRIIEKMSIELIEQELVKIP